MVWQTGERILTEWPAQVVASHALVVAQILAEDEVEVEIFVHLAAEAWTVAKLARLLARQANFINEARAYWREAAQMFEQCVKQWARLPNDGGEPVETHRRLLEQLLTMAADELELYPLRTPIGCGSGISALGGRRKF